MPDPLSLQLREAAEALYGPTPAEMVAIRVLLRDAATALDAREVQPVNTAALHALGGIDVIPMPHLPSATIMASPDMYQAFRDAFPSKPKALGVAPRLRDLDRVCETGRYPYGCTCDPTGSGPHLSHCALRKCLTCGGKGVLTPGDPERIGMATCMTCCGTGKKGAQDA